MKLSIIIPVSRIERFKDCLASLALQTAPAESFEVVAVSTRDLGALDPKDWAFGLRRISADRNHPSHLRNLAVQAATGALLGFLDDDTTLPPGWVADVIRLLDEHPDRIIGGPNVDRRPQFRFALANAIQEHPLLEGLKNHRSLCSPQEKVDAHNVPLSNCAMARAVFERVGGFNDVANYFMDGSEFLYIAGRLSIETYLYASLEIQHDNRPAFLDYFRYKWRARRMIGGNFILFPECYAHAKAIKLVLASFPMVLAVLAVLAVTGGLFTVMTAAAVIWLGVLYGMGWREVRRPAIFALLGPGVFVTQVLMYAGFFTGLLVGMLTVSRSRAVIEHKALRYRVILDAT